MGFVGRLAQNAMNGKSIVSDITGSNRNLHDKCSGSEVVVSEYISMTNSIFSSTLSDTIKL